MDAVRVARVADETDRLACLDSRSGPEAARERHTVHASAPVVVALRQVVVEVDVEVGRPAAAVEIEHAAGAPRAGVKSDAARARRRARARAARRGCRSPGAGPAGGGAEVVRELDVAEHREHDLLARGLWLRLDLRRRLGIRRARGSRPCGEAEKGKNEKYSGCRPGADHEAGGAAKVALRPWSSARCRQRGSRVGLRGSRPKLESRL